MGIDFIFFCCIIKIPIHAVRDVSSSKTFCADLSIIVRGLEGKRRAAASSGVRSRTSVLAPPSRGGPSQGVVAPRRSALFR